ncbi:hypothetical protein Pmani_006866 [Petrolisthes manimaculis]|uniref:DDE Tnp4 domain-containing protein n=1 Tax=Petrolisthes manimaculis TaxID=1843537 RepID=A0AAE1PU58_9EUCA|nr:hypothetical protein Pmani_014348 [Petrolisthes manimaculis]KAK4322383.1 hypothetical protein Pmani_006866 [Petrolisthes manimaculis]
MIQPSICKTDTRMTKAVTPQERLAITLRYLATGETQTSLSYQFRVSQNLISLIIPETCSAIYEALQPIYMRIPRSQEEWRKVSQDFHNLWNYPLCLGALDGKRVLLQKPAHSGSHYYDYKGNFSTIIMALVDADYKFLYADVGTNGRASDGGVWNKCKLKEDIEYEEIGIPPPANLPNYDIQVPYVIVGDDAFPLQKYLMNPYPGNDQSNEKHIHNYRLSRARRVSENAFGILSSRFQVFNKPIRTCPERANMVIQACLVLHNMLRTESRQDYSPPELLDQEDIQRRRMVVGQWHDHQHNALGDLQVIARRPKRDAMQVRDLFCTYFNNEGSVPWQNEMALLH